MEIIYESKKSSRRTTLYYLFMVISILLAIWGMFMAIKGTQMETLWGIGEERKQQTIMSGLFLLVCGIYMFNAVYQYLKTKIFLKEECIELDGISTLILPRISRLNVKYKDIVSVSVKKLELLLVIEGKTYHIECADNKDAEECKRIIEEKRGRME